MNRRGFLGAMLAAAAAPYVITKAGVLMPVKTIETPPLILGVDLAAEGGGNCTVVGQLGYWSGSIFILQFPQNIEQASKFRELEAAIMEDRATRHADPNSLDAKWAAMVKKENAKLRALRPI